MSRQPFDSVLSGRHIKGMFFKEWLSSHELLTMLLRSKAIYNGEGVDVYWILQELFSRRGDSDVVCQLELLNSPFDFAQYTEFHDDLVKLSKSPMATDLDRYKIVCALYPQTEATVTPEIPQVYLDSFNPKLITQVITSADFYIKLLDKNPKNPNEIWEALYLLSYDLNAEQSRDLAKKLVNKFSQTPQPVIKIMLILLRKLEEHNKQQWVNLISTYFWEQLHSANISDKCLKSIELFIPYMQESDIQKWTEHLLSSKVYPHIAFKNNFKSTLSALLTRYKEHKTGWITEHTRIIHESDESDDDAIRDSVIVLDTLSPYFTLEHKKSLIKPLVAAVLKLDTDYIDNSAIIVTSIAAVLDSLVKQAPAHNEQVIKQVLYEELYMQATSLMEGIKTISLAREAQDLTPKQRKDLQTKDRSLKSKLNFISLLIFKCNASMFTPQFLDELMFFYLEYGHALVEQTLVAMDEKTLGQFTFTLYMQLVKYIDDANRDSANNKQRTSGFLEKAIIQNIVHILSMIGSNLNEQQKNHLLSTLVFKTPDLDLGLGLMSDLEIKQISSSMLALAHVFKTIPDSNLKKRLANIYSYHHLPGLSVIETSLKENEALILFKSYVAELKVDLTQMQENVYLLNRLSNFIPAIDISELDECIEKLLSILELVCINSRNNVLTQSTLKVLTSLIQEMKPEHSKYFRILKAAKRCLAHNNNEVRSSAFNLCTYALCSGAAISDLSAALDLKQLSPSDESIEVIAVKQLLQNMDMSLQAVTDKNSQNGF